MKSDFGGRSDSWTVINDGAGMTVENLKSVAPPSGVNRPVKDRGVGKKAGGNNPPSTAEFDRLHSRSDNSEVA